MFGAGAYISVMYEEKRLCRDNITREVLVEAMKKEVVE